MVVFPVKFERLSCRAQVSPKTVGYPLRGSKVKAHHKVWLRRPTQETLVHPNLEGCVRPVLLHGAFLLSEC